MTDTKPILITSPGRGMGTEIAVQRLEDADTVREHRQNMMAVAGQRAWRGQPLTIRVVPSSEVLAEPDVMVHVERLARLGGKAGIRVELIDLERPGIWTLAAFGYSAPLRQLVAGASEHDDPHITCRTTTPEEIADLLR